jgi:hypothetical protein
MRFIFRRAQDTSHLVLLETKDQAVYCIFEFPSILVALSLLGIIGFDTAKQWWVPWSYLMGGICFFYALYRLRSPWAGKQLQDIQNKKI